MGFSLLSSRADRALAQDRLIPKSFPTGTLVPLTNSLPLHDPAIHNHQLNMEYLTSPGDDAFSPSEAKKLVDRINKLGGAQVKEIRGFWMHYTHLKDVEKGTAQVCECRFLWLFCVYQVNYPLHGGNNL